MPADEVDAADSPPHSFAAADWYNVQVSAKSIGVVATPDARPLVGAACGGGPKRLRPIRRSDRRRPPPANYPRSPGAIGPTAKTDRSPG